MKTLFFSISGEVEEYEGDEGSFFAGREITERDTDRLIAVVNANDEHECEYYGRLFRYSQEMREAIQDSLSDLREHMSPGMVRHFLNLIAWTAIEEEA